MTGTLARILAALSLTLRQPLYSFCDVETSHGDALVTKHSDYFSIVRVDGMRKMATRQDVARFAARGIAACAVEAIAFGYLGGSLTDAGLKPGASLELAYRLEINEYRGSERMQLNCQHLLCV